MDASAGENSHARIEEGDKHNTDTVRITEISSVFVNRSDQDGANHEEPVCEWNIQLAMEDFRCVLDGELRKVRQFS